MYLSRRIKYKRLFSLLTIRWLTVSKQLQIKLLNQIIIWVLFTVLFHPVFMTRSMKAVSPALPSQRLNRWRQKCSPVADGWTVNRENVGTSLSCFGSDNKNGETFHTFHQEEIGELFSKNRTRTARRQLEGRQLLLGEYLRSWTTLYLLLDFPLKMRYRYELTSTEVSMFKIVFKLGIILNE